MLDRLRINSFGRAAAHEAAVAQGFYASEDLEVEHAVTNSSKAQMQQLVDGVWNLVHTNADNVFYWSEDRGANLVIVQATGGRANQDFVVRSEIQGYADLRGKVIAVDAAESGFATPLRVLLREHGLQEEGKDFHFFQVGATQQRVEAMRDGRAIGAMVGSAQAEALQGEGFRTLDSINRLYRNHAAGAVAATRPWVAANPELLVRYLRAHIRGATWNSALAEATRAPEPFAWDGLQEMLDLRASLGMLRGPADRRRFADDTYYQRAVATL